MPKSTQGIDMDMPMELNLQPEMETVIVYCSQSVCKEVETDKLVLVYNPKDGFMTIEVNKE